MKLHIQDLTAEAFEPFGKVVQQPDIPQDASGPGWKWWGGTAFMPGDQHAYGIGYLDLQPSVLEFDWAERHMHSAELLVPTGGDCLVYVGPPDHPDEPLRLPEIEKFKVFRVQQGQAVLLDKCVWHGAPLAIDRPLNVVVLLLDGTGETDVHLVRFSDAPVQIEN